MKSLPFGREYIERVAQDHPTPFYIYDEAGMLANLERLHAAFAWNPGFREYFAVKALPNPVIMKLLHEAGCGMDCSSLTELMLSRAVGITGEDIMFSSNDTPKEEYELTRELGGIINLDDITHIEFLKRHGGIPEKISCRYNPGGEFRLGNEIMGSPGEAKYGMTGAQIERAFNELSALGVKEFGLHAFLASSTRDNSYYPALAEELFALAARMKRSTGANVTFINLSGGIGIPYEPGEQAADIERIGAGVREAYERILVPEGLSPAIFTELGRYVTGPYGCLITRAIHRKDIYKRYIGVDACACNLMRPAMYGAYHHITVLGKEHLPNTEVYDIVGALCENNDKFAIDRSLPPIEEGDLLAIHDAGAHGFAMGYNYNGKLRSAELLMRSSGEVELIRRAETPQDYFATLDCLGLKFE